MRQPKQPIEHYLDHRLFYDCAGWAAPKPAAELGADWVRYGMQEVALSQVVFATDYPQAVRDDQEVADYVAAVRTLGANSRAMLDGVNAEKLIPDLRAVTLDPQIGQPFQGVEIRAEPFRGLHQNVPRRQRR